MKEISQGENLPQIEILARTRALANWPAARASRQRFNVAQSRPDSINSQSPRPSDSAFSKLALPSECRIASKA